MGKRTFMNGAYGRTMRRGGRRGGGDRGIGGVGLPPLPVGGANHRWLSTAGITEDGSGVLTWEDVIGGVVMDRSGATGPAVTTNGQVKQPVVRFDGGISNVMSSDAIGGSTVFNAGNDHTVIVMASPNSAVVSNHQFFSASQGALNTSEYAFRINTTPQLIMIRNGSALSIATERPHFDTFSRMIARWDDSGNTFGARVNGIEQAIGNTGDPIAAQDRYTIGASPTLTSNVLGGDVCEVIVYDRRLTDAETTAIDQYLVARYFETVIHELGVALWLDPEEGVAGAPSVTGWTDKVGGVTLATDIGSPQVEDNERMGHKGLRFTADAMTATSPVAELFRDNAGVTVISEVSSRAHASPGSQQTLLVSYEDGAPLEMARLRFSGATPQYENRDAGNTLTASAGGPSDELAARWVVGGNNGTKINCQGVGTAEGLQNSVGSPSLLDTLRIGAGPSDTQLLNDTTVGNTMVFPYALTAAQVQRVTDFVENLWSDVEVPRRLGAVAQWDPTRNDLISIDAGGVESFEDAIGGVVFAQSTPGQRPALVDSIRTGHQMLAFSSASGHHMEATTALADVFEDANAWDVFTEVAFDSGQANRTLLSAHLASAVGTENLRIKTASNGKARLQYESGGTTDTQDNAEVPSLAARWIRAGRDGSNNLVQAIGEGVSSSGLTASAPDFDTMQLGAEDGGITMEGELGQVIIFAHSLNLRDAQVLTDFIEAGWLNAEVPMRLGCDIYLDAADCGTGPSAVWPDRAGGVDFDVANGSAALATLNGRAAVDFDGAFRFERTDPTADSSRTDSTHFMVAEAASEVLFTPIFHGASLVNGDQSVRLQTNAGKMRFVRRTTGTVTATSSADVFEGGIRNFASVSYDDSDGAIVMRSADIDVSPAPVQTTLPVTQAHTFIGASGGGNLEFAGKLSTYIQFAHVMNDDDRAAMEDYIFQKYFDFAAPAGTLGSIDDIAVRWVGADIVSASAWPSREGSLHPLTLTPPGAAPVVADPNPTLGNARTMTFTDDDRLLADVGSGQASTDDFILAVGTFDGSGTFSVFGEFSDLGNGFAPLNGRRGAVAIGTATMRLAGFGSGATINDNTTETIVDGDAFVYAASQSGEMDTADVLLNGVIASFSSTPLVNNAALRFFAVGGRHFGATQGMNGDMAEFIYGRRRLGLAELIAFQRYADITYLDPDLIGA